MKRIAYIDRLRIIASASVIMVHVCASKFTDMVPGTWGYGVFTMIASAQRFCVPVFVMVSGYLFLGRDIKINDLYTRYVARILGIFLCWSAVYYVFGKEIIERGGISRAVKGILSGSSSHLWFLPMLAGLYMMQPVFRNIASDRRTAAYYCATAFFFQYCVPLAIAVADARLPEASWYIGQIFQNAYYLHLPMGYGAYFIIGYLLGTTKLNRRQQQLVYAGGCAGFWGIVIVFYFTGGYAFFDYLTPAVLMESCAVFVFVKDLAEKNEDSDLGQVKIHKLAKLSFGAYLVHILVLDRIPAPQNGNSPWMAAYVPACWLLTLALSYGISWVLNQVPGVRRLVR